jgi:hypothetical protein
MKIYELKTGNIFTHPVRGIGKIVKITQRTVTIKYEKMQIRLTYKHKDSEFNILDF